MANQIYEEQMKNKNNPFGIDRDTLIQKLQQLSSSGNNPTQITQQILNSGKATQEQYNSAVQRAQVAARFFGFNI